MIPPSRESCHRSGECPVIELLNERDWIRSEAAFNDSVPETREADDGQEESMPRGIKERKDCKIREGTLRRKGGVADPPGSN